MLLTMRTALSYIQILSSCNLKQIFQQGQQEPELTNKLREFGALPKVGDVKCSTCGEPMNLWFDKKENESLWRCNKSYVGRARKKKKCNNKKTVKSMSIFEGAHLSFEKIMVFVHEWSQFSEIRKASLEASYWFICYCCYLQ